MVRKRDRSREAFLRLLQTPVKQMTMETDCDFETVGYAIGTWCVGSIITMPNMELHRSCMMLDRAIMSLGRSAPLLHCVDMTVNTPSTQHFVLMRMPEGSSSLQVHREKQLSIHFEVWTLL